jgi:hypothetical protein
MRGGFLLKNSRNNGSKRKLAGKATARITPMTRLKARRILRRIREALSALEWGRSKLTLPPVLS